MKNRIFGLVMASVLTVSAFCGCGASRMAADSDQKEESVPKNAANAAAYSIVCTTFPQYDWIRNIIGDDSDKFQLTMLLDQGTDLHSYQPTAEDIAKIADADMFVYVGGESDGWVESALKEATNKDMKVVNMLDALGTAVKVEEVVPGMQAEEEEETEEGEGPENDEHVWLSLRNAVTLTDALSENIQEIDPANKEDYVENAGKYVDKLNDLDGRYALTISKGKRQAILFGDRFPFRYMADDYGLTYYAAFVGCSAESEASFETITFLAHKVDELKLPVILTIEGADHNIAESIKNATESKNQEILTMNSMQSVTAEDMADGETYLNMMEDNLNVLSQALN
ncbi:metal ABC transporter substrate-binding protein [Coprococcus eutactus]|uniref:metal ABC transporter substrate-binding protein n=1 Tax=Coprococcus eutactus TaxID=33043 RepID=UPI0005D1F1DD|nr:metal ABC transporter substrate-binding protein [Coprococcus eutactus]UEA80733.1 metal ABC transporter substrate-binding protein [Coprococcus eutactus ATCC 27759]UWP17386.1 metal ABC transporter substrate-binding protein [Coprococcus eutactus]